LGWLSAKGEFDSEETMSESMMRYLYADLKEERI